MLDSESEESISPPSTPPQRWTQRRAGGGCGEWCDKYERLGLGEGPTKQQEILRCLRKDCRSVWAAFICIFILLVFLGFILVMERRLAFSNNYSEDEVAGEKIFLSSIKDEELKAHLEYYTSMPHLAGSDQDYQLALYTQQKMKEYGIPEVEIETVPLLLNRPLDRLVEIVNPPNLRFVASLTEKAYEEDPTSSLPDAVPTFNGYSGWGEATGQLVYANYGRLQDYDYLQSQGIDLTGRIVIVRYGKIYRGNKAHFAEARGAIGCLIYSDPADDGFAKGPVYPHGPWRPETGVQRGAVWVGNGDPATPGWPSTADGPRLTLDEARDPTNPHNEGYDPLPTIPIQPLSWGDAYRMLAGLGGKTVPSSEWQGALNFTYRIGPGPVEIHMSLGMNYSTMNTWNVIGRIPGTLEPDRLVILGNHRDAWGFGAGDAGTGAAALLGVAQGLGQALKWGWKPRRTILLCSWDAEEYGLIGSVEFVERHFNVLRQQAIVYFNVDVGVTGKAFKAAGSPQLRKFLRSVTDSVQLPKSMYNPRPSNPHYIPTVSDLWYPYVFPSLGSGSDYMGFLQLVGVSCVDMRLTSRGSSADPYDGVYHSNYDSFYWIKNYGDPTFELHGLMAKVWGLAAMRIATALVLPFEFTAYAQALTSMVSTVKVPEGGEAASVLAALRVLNGSIDRLYQTAAAVSSEAAALLRTDQPTIYQLRSINDRMMFFERAFISDRGTAGRLLYKHLIYAPSPGDNYAGLNLPTIHEAIAHGDWAEAKFQILLTSQFVDGATELLAGSLS
jgi:N-acetylated-alpha-linked acidic dipeptidase